MVDLAGIVYYPVYWDLAHRFFELSWEEICGIDYPKIIQELRLGFPAVKNECEFLAPLKYGDIVNVRSGFMISEIKVVNGNMNLKIKIKNLSGKPK